MSPKTKPSAAPAKLCAHCVKPLSYTPCHVRCRATRSFASSALAHPRCPEPILKATKDTHRGMGGRVLCIFKRARRTPTHAASWSELPNAKTYSPSPLWGGIKGGGAPRLRRIRIANLARIFLACRRTPAPSRPSPQGEGTIRQQGHYNSPTPTHRKSPCARAPAMPAKAPRPWPPISPPSAPCSARPTPARPTSPSSGCARIPAG